jgi:hypothetical protein
MFVLYHCEVLPKLTTEEPWPSKLARSLAYALAAWIAVLEKLIDSQSRNSPRFIGTEGSVLHSQGPSPVPILSQINPFCTLLHS